MTDSAGTMALPRTTLVRSGDPERDRRTLVELIIEEEAVTVVVGLPLSLDGSSGPAASAAEPKRPRRLRRLLETHGVEVQLFDERLTTVTAHQALAAGGEPTSATGGRWSTRRRPR